MKRYHMEDAKPGVAVPDDHGPWVMVIDAEAEIERVRRDAFRNAIDILNGQPSSPRHSAPLRHIDVSKYFPSHILFIVNQINDVIDAVNDLREKVK